MDIKQLKYYFILLPKEYIINVCNYYSFPFNILTIQIFLGLFPKNTFFLHNKLRQTQHIHAQPTNVKNTQ